MIITTLFVLLVIATFLQFNSERLYVALIYTSSVVVSDLFFHGLSGEFYFLFDAAFNLLAIILLTALASLSVLAKKLAVLSLLSIVVNVLGWLLWDNSMPLIVYEVLFMCIYGYAIFNMMKKEGRNGGLADNTYSVKFFDYIYSRSTRLLKH